MKAGEPGERGPSLVHYRECIDDEKPEKAVVDARILQAVKDIQRKIAEEKRYDDVSNEELQEVHYILSPITNCMCIVMKHFHFDIRCLQHGHKLKMLSLPVKPNFQFQITLGLKTLNVYSLEGNFSKW